MNFKKLSMGFLGVLVATAVYAADTTSSGSATAVAAAPTKPWSVTTSYGISRSLEVVPSSAASIPVNASAYLGASWAFGPAFQAKVEQTLDNEIGVASAPNFLIGDTTLTFTAPGLLKLTALDAPVTGVAVLVLPTSQVSQSMGLLGVGVLVVTASKEFAGWKTKATLKSSLYGFESSTFQVPGAEAGTKAPSKITAFTSALEVAREWLGVTWGVAVSLENTLRYSVNPTHTLRLSPFAKADILENLNVSVGVAEDANKTRIFTATFGTKKTGNSGVVVTPALSWEPVANVSVDLSVISTLYGRNADTKQYEWKGAQLASYEPSLSVGYTF